MKRSLLFTLITAVSGFSTRSESGRFSSARFSATAEGDAVTTAIDKKEAVKLFGRLAEKYIMLDDTAGMCCYSACSDCEYRLPGGGYRMADQSAARPKWIPSYTERSANDKEHTTKWSSQIFTDGPAVNKEEFVERLVELDYAPPLGGPYVGASAASIDETSAAERLFDILVAEGKDVLTQHRMSLQLKEFANGEQGVNWSMFQEAIGA